MKAKADNKGSSTPVIRYIDVHKSFDKKSVHRGINLTVNEGEILTLMGGSGSGKSVLLRTLIGLEKIDRGKIFFHNIDVTQLKEEEFVPIRKKIAYVFQYGALFDSLTVKANLAYPLREHTTLNEEQIGKKVLLTLKKLGLEGSEQMLPADLSGGMQKRVGVARSIIMDPEVILYDEPTSGLDPYNTKQILKIILQLKEQGATSILVTHDMGSLFAVSDHVALLREGKIVAQGTATEIRDNQDPTLQGFIQGETM